MKHYMCLSCQTVFPKSIDAPKILCPKGCGSENIRPLVDITRWRNRLIFRLRGIEWSIQGFNRNNIPATPEIVERIIALRDACNAWLRNEELKGGYPK